MVMPSTPSLIVTAEAVAPVVTATVLKSWETVPRLTAPPARTTRSPVLVPIFNAAAVAVTVLLVSISRRVSPTVDPGVHAPVKVTAAFVELSPMRRISAAIAFNSAADNSSPPPDPPRLIAVLPVFAFSNTSASAMAAVTVPERSISLAIKSIAEPAPTEVSTSAPLAMVNVPNASNLILPVA